MLIHTCLFLGEGTNEQDPVKCSGVGCENSLHRWYVEVVEVMSVLLHYINSYASYLNVKIMTYPCFISFMALADIIAYIQKKKKVISSKCPATTAVKTIVSIKGSNSYMHSL